MRGAVTPGANLRPADSTPGAQPASPVPRGELFCALSTVWDVDRLNARMDAEIAAGQAEIHRLNPLDVARASVAWVDDTKLDSLTHPERPVIVAEICNAAGAKVGTLLLDGNHRVARAIRDGAPHIDVYVIRAPLEREYRL